MGEFAARYGPWAVVTGAAQGVGLAFAEALVARGVGVVMVDVSPEVAAAAAAVGDEAVARPLVADLGHPSWIEALDAECAGLEVGLAVANAGVAYVGRFLDMDAACRRAILEVNCAATADLAAWALPAMVERGRGGLMSTSSGSALSGTGGVALYSATKAYGVNLMEAIGWELKGTGVHTLAVVAPAMNTPMLRSSGFDEARAFAPPVAPRQVVEGALDALGGPTRWLADESLEFA
ncbi:MAG: SDR family NAD(P)-dependent oxidoreductase, partial [Microthrixaceae bacterium]|nr:SDR family NAD(P)-dependent oxidoreductase [Microthrixaceae bacterium]